MILTAVLAIASAQPAAGWTATTYVPPARTPGDPWEKSNRGVFRFNQRLDHTLLGPLSRLTSGLTPGIVGKAIHNFLANLQEPVVVINDLLQARPAAAVKSAFRLIINTTVGGLGAIDVATALGNPRQVNGFGDTLGRWGVAPGPYLVLPVLGPATVRDLFGSIADDATVPLQFVAYPYRWEVDLTVAVVGGLNQRAAVGRDLDALLAGAADPYATLRSSYLQSREAQIRGEKALPPLPDIEDATPPAATPETPAASEASAAAPAAAAPPPVAPPQATAPESEPAQCAPPADEGVGVDATAESVPF